jgi:hypothetical protein
MNIKKKKSGTQEAEIRYVPARRIAHEEMPWMLPHAPKTTPSGAAAIITLVPAYARAQAIKIQKIT